MKEWMGEDEYNLHEWVQSVKTRSPHASNHTRLASSLLLSPLPLPLSPYLLFNEI